MINKRDINKLRNPEDLERKYNLNDILALQQNYELQKNSLNKVENELNNFVLATSKNLKELQDQVDGNITTWFYSGVPTENNEPASEWTTDSEKNNHLGDLYYDKDTGYAYRYSLDNGVYDWIKITDTDVTQALAIANGAKDTADSKRRVFVVEPTPPYDNGDMWIKDNEIWICQISKQQGETYEDNDFINNLKYTDDTKANQVGENLTILSGTVTTIKENVDELNSTMTNTTKLVDEQGKELGILSKNTTSISQTVNEVSISISSIKNNTYSKDEVNKIIDGSDETNKVSFVKTTTVLIDENGQTVDKDGSPVKSNMDADGFEIIDKLHGNDTLLEAKYDPVLGETKVRSKHLIVEKYLTVGTHSRFEDYENGTGCFYIS